METRNELYPIFLRTDRFRTLIVGGGKVALEKLAFLYKSSPRSKVTALSLEFIPEVMELLEARGAKVIIGPYLPAALDGHHLVIAATNVRSTNARIHSDARARHLLVNVADTPDLCDFYLGGIVTKGDVKIGISTNGRSPSLAKALRIFFETALPEDIDQLAKSLNRYRSQLGSDLEERVAAMSEVTELLIQGR